MVIAWVKTTSNVAGTFIVLTANICGDLTTVRMIPNLWGCLWKKKAKRRKEKHVSDPLSDLSDAGLCTLFRIRLDRVSSSKRTKIEDRL